MKFFRLLGAALAAVVLAGAPVAAQPRNPLEAYVARPDPTFAWKVVGPISGPGYHGAVLEMTSQTWLSPKEVDRSVWKHFVTVVVPDKVAHDKALLFIGGGDNEDPAPTKPADRSAKIAVETSSVVVELGQVPNQPLRFTETPDKARFEDDIIAYQQAKYAKSGDPNQILRLAMVKSGTAAMTAVQQYMASEAGGRVKLNGFVVAGGSKRGWTTWLVGALDKRVVAIMPIVIDVLNADAVTRHHWQALGYFSPALEDYVNHGIIPGMMGTPALKALRDFEDPYSYLGRASLRMPKYIINASGDEFFLPDNSQFYWDAVREEKRLRYLPNSKHNTSGTDIAESMIAWYGSVLNGTPRPRYSWTRRGDQIVVRAAQRPREVLLWQATNPKARDFRVDTIGKAYTSTRLLPRRDGTYVANLVKPASGFTASFVELSFDSGGNYPFKFTTEVVVTPNTLPYDWKDARPITKPAD
ncbi:PhoPQ-activated pathogenicity-related family protein [Phenylobacterium sp.]|uniref:PhoPQ-activated pathogenicity-related family protein n=1 Tax=Phenylobacterium sp. TaxID=1871053 RepID=UPI0039836D4F